MARLVAFIFGLMLCLSVAIGSVAHAAEGPLPLESSCAVVGDHGDDDGGSSGAGKAISDSHACHGHHIGVPLGGVAAPARGDLTPLMIATSERPLPSARLRTPIRPPRA